MSNTNTWNINKLKKEQSKITKRTQIGLNNLKQRLFVFPITRERGQDFL